MWKLTSTNIHAMYSAPLKNIGKKLFHILAVRQKSVNSFQATEKNCLQIILLSTPKIHAVENRPYFECESVDLSIGMKCKDIYCGIKWFSQAKSMNNTIAVFKTCLTKLTLQQSAHTSTAIDNSIWFSFKIRLYMSIYDRRKFLWHKSHNSL